MVAWGTAWQGGAPGDPLGPRELAAVGAGAGAVVGLVLHLTRGYRSRGALQHFCAWMLAGAVAALVIVSPDLASGGWRTVLFALWGGAGGGFALGAVEVYWRAHGEREGE